MCNCTFTFYWLNSLVPSTCYNGYSSCDASELYQFVFYVIVAKFLMLLVWSFWSHLGYCYSPIWFSFIKMEELVLYFASRRNICFPDTSFTDFYLSSVSTEKFIFHFNCNCCNICLLATWVIFKLCFCRWDGISWVF